MIGENQKLLLGLDIGGTKSAVCVGRYTGDNLTVEKKEKIPTNHSISPEAMLERLMTMADALLCGERPNSVGVSCGGPLNSVTGRILGPPNLPGWDDVPVVDILADHFGVPVFLQNDANACAVAEWKFGSGRGTKNMVFLTFGTGLGAGLILNGQLYAGTNDMAGEVGHIRLNSYGPVGYGKNGSFEGFCSGAGIAQIGYALALEAIQNGKRPLYFKEGDTAESVTAKSIADAADAGDPTAIDVYRMSGEYLGKGLSVLIDILNPEVIVIGSIFTRSDNLLRENMQKVIDEEALPASAASCRILPASLGESLGDYAALSTALL